MDSDKILFAFARWLCADTKHENKIPPGTELELCEEFYRSLLVFATANDLAEPDDYDGVSFPSYDY